MSLLALVMCLVQSSFAAAPEGGQNNVVYGGGVNHVPSLSVRPFSRFIEPQHGAIYVTELSMLELDPVGAGGDSVGSLPLTILHSPRLGGVLVFNRSLAEVVLNGGTSGALALNGNQGQPDFEVCWYSGGKVIRVRAWIEDEGPGAFTERCKKLVENMETAFPPDSPQPAGGC